MSRPPRTTSRGGRNEGIQTSPRGRLARARNGGVHRVLGEPRRRAHRAGAHCVDLLVAATRGAEHVRAGRARQGRQRRTRRAGRPEPVGAERHADEEGRQGLPRNGPDVRPRHPRGPRVRGRQRADDHDQRTDRRAEPRLRRGHGLQLPARRRRLHDERRLVRHGLQLAGRAARKGSAPPGRVERAQHLPRERRRAARLGDLAVEVPRAPEPRRHRRQLRLASGRDDRGLQPRAHRHARGGPLVRALPHVPGRLLRERRRRRGHAAGEGADVRLPGRQGHVHEGPGPRPDPQLHGLLDGPVLLGVHARARPSAWPASSSSSASSSSLAGGCLARPPATLSSSPRP